MAFSTFPGTNTVNNVNIPKLYIYNYFGSKIHTKSNGYLFNSDDITMNTRSKTLTLSNVLLYGYTTDKNYSILQNSLGRSRLQQSQKTHNLVYLSSYKTILDFGKFLYYYLYCRNDPGKINNIFISIDYIACNIGAIFIPSTIMGKKNPSLNVSERYYFRKHIIDLMKMSGCLYDGIRKIDLTLRNNIINREFFCIQPTGQATPIQLTPDPTGLSLDDDMDLTPDEREVVFYDAPTDFSEFGKRKKSNKTINNTNNDLLKINKLIKLVKKF
jgi:hypothetical protein